MSAAGSSTLDFAFVGCFTTPERRARGLGIDVYRTGGSADPRRWSPTQRVEGLTNPSFLVSDPERRVLYVVHGDADHATAFALEPESGQLRSLGSAATGGTNVVHQALDPSGCFLIVANYGSGSVSVLPVRTDGALEPAIQVLELTGPRGPHRSDQASAHPHQIVFDPSGAFVLVPDKGLDRLFVLAFAGGRVERVGEVAMRPGAGPRHLVFHPQRPLVFLLNELDSTLAVLRWDPSGRLTPLGLASTLPVDFFGASTAAAIVMSPCGRFVFTSNRGQDGIARFVVGPDDGGMPLAAADWTPCGGRDPRFMTMAPDGWHLLVANEQGDSLNCFAIDPASGALSLAGARDSLSPCAMAFL